HDGVLALPGHRLGQLKHGGNRVEPGPIPMVCENAPTAFNGMVCTVIGRVVAQPNRDVIVLHEVHEPLPNLGAPTLVLGALIELEDPRRQVGPALTTSLPPRPEALSPTITGPCRGDAS